jgi:periplasmic protein TonB
VPDHFTNLLPPDLTKPKASSSAPPPAPSGPAPRFGPPAHLVPDNLWSNLRDFLFERPVKLGPAKIGTPFRGASFGAGLRDNLKDFFSKTPAAARTPGNSRLEINWNASFGGYWHRIKEGLFPTKLPPLHVTSKPVKVKDIWSKDENFGWTQAISIGLHGALLALLLVPIIFNVVSPPTQASSKTDVLPLDLSPYMSKLPAGKDKAGGGGGGGDRSPTPPTKGRAPRFAWNQFTPPTAVIKNQNPKLPMDPTLLGPPDLKVANPPLPNYGDPLAASVNLSNGPGGGGGIGTGEGGGIGSGSGGGLGPGSGGGTGGGAFRAGVNGVGIPSCIYCPDPAYSEEARKAKYQGIVVLQLVVGVDGRVTHISVVKGPGLGLEEKAIEAMRQARFKPALGPNGRAVPVIVNYEVTFRLF